MIGGTCEVHKFLCDRVSSLLTVVRKCEDREAHLGSWSSAEDYSLLPLYRAIIVVLDELADPVVELDGRILLVEEYRGSISSWF